MFGARLVLALLTLPLLGYSAKTQVPGSHGTKNNYSVCMDDTQECRHPADGKPKGSKHIHVVFQAFDDGLVKAPLRITNDDASRSFCGRVRIVVRDRANPPGNILLDVKSPRLCIDPKGADTDWHERTGTLDWSFKTDPRVGQDLQDLWMEPVDYDEKVDVSKIVGAAEGAVRIAAGVFKVAAAIGIP